MPTVSTYQYVMRLSFTRAELAQLARLETKKKKSGWWGRLQLRVQEICGQYPAAFSPVIDRTWFDAHPELGDAYPIEATFFASLNDRSWHRNALVNALHAAAADMLAGRWPHYDFEKPADAVSATLPPAQPSSESNEWRAFCFYRGNPDSPNSRLVTEAHARSLAEAREAACEGADIFCDRENLETPEARRAFILNCPRENIREYQLPRDQEGKTYHDKKAEQKSQTATGDTP